MICDVYCVLCIYLFRLIVFREKQISLTFLWCFSFYFILSLSFPCLLTNYFAIKEIRERETVVLQALFNFLKHYSLIAWVFFIWSDKKKFEMLGNDCVGKLYIHTYIKRDFKSNCHNPYKTQYRAMNDEFCSCSCMPLMKMMQVIL